VTRTTIGLYNNINYIIHSLFFLKIAISTFICVNLANKSKQTVANR